MGKGVASAQLVQVRGAMHKQGVAIAEQHVEVAMTGQFGADARQHWGQPSTWSEVSPPRAEKPVKEKVVAACLLQLMPINWQTGSPQDRQKFTTAVPLTYLGY
jgi:hypothetical protein